MVIVFFEYGPKLYFFGVTSGKQTTRCSLSYSDVANELQALEEEEWQDGREIPRPAEVQGMALRTFQFIAGYWVAVDVEDGIITVVATLDEGDACYCMSSSEPEEVLRVNGPESARDFVDQLASSHGLGG
ncbi:hypothetical protein HGP14_13235 [Rhizobium sp. P32RR-XVIII]|uniref:hypothetical protein n=1 Tax=Rhizobium sp. P32RR-XVIII TaxID=2726738 RepID=UPI0014578E92|nr:hypothetical protein [Rhizobium sp. P32RR-XVIII]NLS04319.1 hypothetical protein [Rhizobium sp. P32RR-XVIII]